MVLTKEQTISFSVIKRFVQDISQAHPEYRELKVYNHLLEKTNPSKTAPVCLHIEAFKSFCVENVDAILENAESKITDKDIRYKPENSQIHFNLKKVFEMATSENKKIIWRHLLILLKNVIPETKERVQDVMKQQQEESKEVVVSDGGDSLDDELLKLFTEIKNNEGKVDNPLTLVSTILPKITEKLTNNKDPRAFSRSIRNILNMFASNINDNGNEQVRSLLGMLDKILSDMDEGKQPDLSQLMPMVMPMMMQFMSNMN